MRIWVDDVRPAPKGYVWCKSVNGVKYLIQIFEKIERVNILEYDTICEQLLFSEVFGDFDSLFDESIEIIDIDHDAGEYKSDGGDYIKLLDWLEETDRDYPIRIHSMNPVGKENMRRIIRKNRWEEIE